MLPELPEGEWDQPLGSGSGAGVIFGTTGGVMEAALRTVSHAAVNFLAYSEEPPCVFAVSCCTVFLYCVISPYTNSIKQYCLLF